MMVLVLILTIIRLCHDTCMSKYEYADYHNYNFLSRSKKLCSKSANDVVAYKYEYVSSLNIFLGLLRILLRKYMCPCQIDDDVMSTCVMPSSENSIFIVIIRVLVAGPKIHIPGV